MFLSIVIVSYDNLVNVDNGLGTLTTQCKLRYGFDLCICRYLDWLWCAILAGVFYLPQSHFMIRDKGNNTCLRGTTWSLTGRRTCGA